jgi:hypothetical protein
MDFSVDCPERKLQLWVRSCYSSPLKPLREKVLICAVVLERVVCFDEGVSVYTAVAFT